MTEPTPTNWKDWRPPPVILVSGLALLSILAWSYLSQMWQLLGTWWNQPDYGHGFFVPVFSVALLYIRREMIQSRTIVGSWWGGAFLALWALMRWASIYFNYPAVDRLSLLPCVAGFTLFVGGWQAMRWAWPSIVFLFFMLPLPAFCAEMLSQPLQRVATITSVFVIQTLGIPASADGNVIKLANSPTPLEVEQACSGLRMLMLFFAICVGAALVMRCTLWEKGVIIVSAVPIAIISNVTRISLTALLHHLELGDVADKVFHDGAGLLMMPIAMALLWGELVLLKKLFSDLAPEGPLSLAGALAGAPRSPQPRGTAGGSRS